jgi:hypothetical protein
VSVLYTIISGVWEIESYAKQMSKPGRDYTACNPSTGEVKAGGSQSSKSGGVQHTKV